MIRPTKYLNLKTSVIHIATVMLAELQRVSFISLAELNELIQTRISESARINFVSALNFLYLTGCIDYSEETDTIIYLHRRN